MAQGALKASQIKQAVQDIGRGLLILIHGDASMAGEGIVQETLNLSGLPGFSVGGTLHLVVNNQIGFTTLSAEGRSTTYASDVARMLQTPIFHMNGEVPHAVAQCLELALDHCSFDKVGRPISATPATGSPSSHRLEQARLFKAVFDAQQNMALLTTFNEVDMTEVKNARTVFS